VGLFYSDAIEELLFDDLPEELQFGIESLAEKNCMNIDELWLDVQMGEYSLPRDLNRQLKSEARKKAREEHY